MRRVHRNELLFQDRLELYKRSKGVTNSADARKAWKSYRASISSRQVIATLAQMTGNRKRCVYCCDSRSSDVDHFVPISQRFDYTLRWSNLILICPECNRYKGSSFKLDANGEPLLVDPTRIDPWVHLVLDHDTGILAPRFINPVGFDESGEYTLDLLSPLNDEATAEGRRRTAEAFCDMSATTLTEGDNLGIRKQWARIIAYDDYGLAPWFAFWEGSTAADFPNVKREFPLLWRRFIVMAANR